MWLWLSSYVDFYTLAKTLPKGNVPRSFWERVGFTEEYIEHILPLLSKSIQFYQCVISYSHIDEEFAKRLYYRLRDANIGCWLDQKDVSYSQINQGVSRTFL